MKTYLLLLVIGNLLMACETSPKPTNLPLPPQAAIEVAITIKTQEENIYLHQPINVILSIHNTMIEPITFCALHTPFHADIKGNCFVIQDAKRQEIAYNNDTVATTSSLIKASMISIDPLDTITDTIDLTQYYNFTKTGTYRIQFKGNNTNLLPHSPHFYFTIQ